MQGASSAGNQGITVCFEARNLLTPAVFASFAVQKKCLCFFRHRKKGLIYSVLSASIGSSLAAFRAGKNPASIAINIKTITSITIGIG